MQVDARTRVVTRRRDQRAGRQHVGRTRESQERAAVPLEYRRHDGRRGVHLLDLLHATLELSRLLKLHRAREQLTQAVSLDGNDLLDGLLLAGTVLGVDLHELAAPLE